jgi:hypothetical protein
VEIYFLFSLGLSLASPLALPVDRLEIYFFMGKSQGFALWNGERHSPFRAGTAQLLPQKPTFLIS